MGTPLTASLRYWSDVLLGRTLPLASSRVKPWLVPTKPPSGAPTGATTATAKLPLTSMKAAAGAGGGGGAWAAKTPPFLGSFTSSLIGTGGAGSGTGAGAGAGRILIAPGAIPPPPKPPTPAGRPPVLAGTTLGGISTSKRTF